MASPNLHIYLGNAELTDVFFNQLCFGGLQVYCYEALDRNSSLVLKIHVNNLVHEIPATMTHFDKQTTRYILYLQLQHDKAQIQKILSPSLLPKQKKLESPPTVMARLERQIPAQTLPTEFSKYEGLAKSKDFYRRLGFSNIVPIEDLQVAFFKYCETFHPDFFLTASPDDRRRVEETFFAISEAYQFLRSQKKKETYDKERSTSESPMLKKIVEMKRAQSPRAGTSGDKHLYEVLREVENLIALKNFKSAKQKLLLLAALNPGNQEVKILMNKIKELE